MAERAAEIAELLKSLSGKALETPLGGLEIHFHAPIVIGSDPNTAQLLRLLLDALVNLPH